MWFCAPALRPRRAPMTGFHDCEDFFPAERVSRSWLAGNWSPLRPVRCDEGSRLPAAVVSPAPSAPEDYSHFGQAGISVEFMGLVAYLVHYRPLNTPLSPDPPPRRERCDGTDQRYRRQHWSNATLSGKAG
jgi:hypothetical protein